MLLHSPRTNSKDDNTTTTRGEFGCLAVAADCLSIFALARAQHEDVYLIASSIIASSTFDGLLFYAFCTSPPSYKLRNRADRPISADSLP